MQTPIESQHKRYNLGAAWLLWVIAGVVVLCVGYAGRPDSATCQSINAITPGSCSSNPPLGVFIAAAVCGAIAVFLLARNVWHHGQQ